MFISVEYEKHRTKIGALRNISNNEYSWEDFPSKTYLRRLLPRNDKIKKPNLKFQSLSKALRIASATARVAPYLLQALETDLQLKEKT